MVKAANKTGARTGATAHPRAAKAAPKSTTFSKARGKKVLSAARRAEIKREYDATIAECVRNNSICIFTDGSCAPSNPGQTGAGMCVYVPAHLQMPQSKPAPQLDTKLAPALALASTTPISTPASSERVDARATAYVCAWQCLGHATNNIGELNAIGMAATFLNGCTFKSTCEVHGVPTAGKLRRVCEHGAGEVSGMRIQINWERVKSIELFSDSDYSVGTFTRGWSGAANADLIARIKGQLAQYRSTAYAPPLNIRWIRAHSGIDGNELSDALANRGRVDVTSRNAMRVEVVMDSPSVVEEMRATMASQ